MVTYPTEPNQTASNEMCQIDTQVNDVDEIKEISKPFLHHEGADVEFDIDNVDNSKAEEETALMGVSVDGEVETGDLNGPEV